MSCKANRVGRARVVHNISDLSQGTRKRTIVAGFTVAHAEQG
jgi:hypothetical protein